MKVLHINSTIVENSGVMSVLMNYFRNIDNKRIIFDFLYFQRNKYNYKSYEEEICHLGGKAVLFENIINIISFNKRLNNLLMSNNYNIIHIHDPFVLPLIYPTLRKNKINNIIVHSHATQWSDKKLSMIRNSIICWNIRGMVAYPFACSIAAGKFLFGNDSNVFILKNAINIEKFKFTKNIRGKIRNELNLNKKLVFGHVGAFCNQKNHRFLISVFKNISNITHNACLLLIGDGILKQDIENLVKKEGLSDKVLFLGKRYNVEEYYQAMDCFILPSLYEGLPMVGVEAQCSGLPVVFSDTITKEIGGPNAVFISLKESKDIWALKCVELSMRKYDRTQGANDITKMGFNIKSESKKLENKYFEIINQNSK